MIDIEAADGILYTENMVFANATLNVEYPVVLKSKYVRAAHIYNIAFSHMRQNFSMAGLLSLIQVKKKYSKLILYAPSNETNRALIYFFFLNIIGSTPI